MALCGCTTQTVEDAKQIEESKTYVSKYEYETDTDGKTETQAYSEEKPTFTDWETVTGITDPAVDYKEGTVKYKSMNEEFSMGAYEYSVTEAVTTKDLNYAYEIMNKDSADLIVNDKINAALTGREELKKYYLKQFEESDVPTKVLGNFRTTIETTGFNMNSHNTYIDILFYFGILGLFLLFIYQFKRYHIMKETQYFYPLISLKLLILIGASSVSIMSATFLFFFHFLL